MMKIGSRVFSRSLITNFAAEFQNGGSNMALKDLERYLFLAKYGKNGFQEDFQVVDYESWVRLRNQQDR